MKKVPIQIRTKRMFIFLYETSDYKQGILFLLLNICIRCQPSSLRQLWYLTMASNKLPVYDSESSSSSSEDFDRAPKKKTRTNHNYHPTLSFKNKEAALETVLEVKEWRHRYSAETEAGRKWYYDCKVSRSCPVKMYILFEENSQRVNS